MAVLPSTSWRSVERPREPTTTTPALRAAASAPRASAVARGPQPCARTDTASGGPPSSSTDAVTWTSIRSRPGSSAAAAAPARLAPSDSVPGDQHRARRRPGAFPAQQRRHDQHRDGAVVNGEVGDAAQQGGRPAEAARADHHRGGPELGGQEGELGARVAVGAAGERLRRPPGSAGQGRPVGGDVLGVDAALPQHEVAEVAQPAGVVGHPLAQRGVGAGWRPHVHDTGGEVGQHARTDRDRPGRLARAVEAHEDHTGATVCAHGDEYAANRTSSGSVCGGRAPRRERGRLAHGVTTTEEETDG